MGLWCSVAALAGEEDRRAATTGAADRGSATTGEADTGVIDGGVVELSLHAVVRFAAAQGERRRYSGGWLREDG